MKKQNQPVNQPVNQPATSNQWFDRGYADFHNDQPAQRAAVSLIDFALGFSKKNPQVVTEHVAFEPVVKKITPSLQK